MYHLLHPKGVAAGRALHQLPVPRHVKLQHHDGWLHCQDA